MSTALAFEDPEDQPKVPESPAGKRLLNKEERVRNEAVFARREKQKEKIRSYTLGKLGKPPNFFDVQVKFIDEDTYRVNILIEKPLKKGERYPRYSIVDSYAIQILRDGDDYVCNPAIEVGKYKEKKDVTS